MPEGLEVNGTVIKTHICGNNLPGNLDDLISGFYLFKIVNQTLLISELNEH